MDVFFLNEAILLNVNKSFNFEVKFFLLNNQDLSLYEGD